ncbi:diacylglycerol kinase [Campylobacter hepaticus]|uniref:Diacylglycerol kinase n=1 Tax=Campylobacter hepaticus TaxID=1813019 RepID=A0A424YZL8_9BACT|nr:diacylglycerol kinase [Campylobacter hepaticus]MCZ0771815.1 diacylglycerol kinase [Campylobacter hepaticus]MCZ0773318.1 diacylglycerol kinase [Campylobacter hepaticus]MCZ0774569.1 diacylglycerol kinase [Campylobacter hepaticus]MDX2323884.1 diacylglycerol kinase [Campylobacter hepaticus]MDX2331785.1 diacylglycerol kinase [Campylobacter hepaticus]
MKPKYHFFNNAKYALEGILTLCKNETSFKIELCIIIPFFILSFFLQVNTVLHLILIAVLILILIAEAFNSAIEACVDLVTHEWHEKAKIAKDCASAGVFFSILLALFVWGFVLYSVFL